MHMRTGIIPGLLICTLTGFLQAGTIHGFVREKETREPVVMGNVWIKDSYVGTTTNMKGYYVLPSLEDGEYDVCFRYIGYKTVVRTISVENDKDIKLDIFLESEAIFTEGTEIVADREKRELDIKPGQITVSGPRIRNMASVGEADLFRSIQMLPGVATLSDFSAGLYIRGGSPDQNLILLDQIDVYNPNHMFGFFSTFNTDAIKSVELLKGGFPAMYGGRLSSVLSVLNKEGDRENFHGVTRLSLVSASATLEGPWKYGSWMLSGRRTYLDLAAKLVDFDLPYYFYDGHGKINFDIDKNNQASISFYIGNDLLDFSSGGTNINLDWGNKTFSSQWTHLFSSKLFSHFVFAGSRFDSDTGVDFDKVSFGIFNEISDLAFKGQLTYTPNLKHSLDFGFEAKFLDFDLNYHIVDTDYKNSFEGTYTSLYMQDNIKITDLTILQTGLRLDYYSDGSYTRLNPRISLKQRLTDKIHFTTSYGKYHQFLNLVQQEGFSFADMWFPVDHTFNPGEADHYIFGVTYDNKTTFSVEAEFYYKYYRNIAEYRVFRGADELLENQTAEQNFLQGRGMAYGGDLYLRNRIGRFEGWIGYTVCWTKKKVDGYNFGLEYFPTYDRRHTITAIQDIHLHKKWRLNVAFKFGSGQPYTEATAKYAVMDPEGRIHYETLDSRKNAYRLPDYHRLDIGIFYKTTLFKKPAELYIQAVNVYNHKNVWFRYYKTHENPATVEDFYMLPMIPTFGLSIHF